MYVLGINGELGTNLKSDYTVTLNPNDLVIPIMRSDSGFSGGRFRGRAQAKFGMMVPRAKGATTVTLGSYPITIPEGGSLITIPVNTVNIANGTRLYWRINHITTDETDFAEYEINDRETIYDTDGEFIINNNTGEFFVMTSRNDTENEGPQTFTVIVSLTVGGPPLITTATITIVEISFSYTTPGTYTFIPARGNPYKYGTITGIGGGGGGTGHYRTRDTSDKRPGGGGGGGGGFKSYYNADDISGNITIVVGSGGAAGNCFYFRNYNGSGNVLRTGAIYGNNGTQTTIAFNKTSGGIYRAVAGGGGGAVGNYNDDNSGKSGGGGSASGGAVNSTGAPGAPISSGRDRYPRTEGGKGAFQDTYHGNGGQSQSQDFLNDLDFDLPYPGNPGCIIIALSTVASGYEGQQPYGQGETNTIYNGGQGTGTALGPAVAGNDIVDTISNMRFLPATLTEAQFEAPTIGAITPMAAPSALISDKATSGFAASINITSSPTGVLTFYYRLTSASDFGGSVTFGDFILGGNGETQRYDSTWNVSNGVPDVIGTYSGPASLTIYELNTVKTSAAATITALQANFPYTLSAASGLISTTADSGFNSTINITSSADNKITFYYRLTSSGTVGQTVSMGTLTLSSGQTNKTYSPNWSVTTKTVDMSGSLKFTPSSVTNAIRNRSYKTTVEYSGLEANFNFTLTPLFGEVSLNDVAYSSSINFTTSPTGTVSFYYTLVSANTFNGAVDPGKFTLSAPGQTSVIISPVGWSITTGVAKIDGTISSPTNITGAIRSQAYTAEVSLTGFEPNVTFTISHSGSPGKIGTSNSSFATSINVNTDGNGSAIIWYRLTASGNYSSDVSMPALTITGGGANRSYTPTWKVTTVASPENIPIPDPSSPSEVFVNQWYSAPVPITGGVPGQSYTLSTVGLGTLSGQLSNNNSTWGNSTTFTINSLGNATIYYRLYSENYSNGTSSMPALLLTVNGTGETRQFTTGWTITTILNAFSPGGGGAGSLGSFGNVVQNATPGQFYTSGNITFSQGIPNSAYRLVARPIFPSVQSYKPKLEGTWVEINAGSGWGQETTGYTDGNRSFIYQVRVKALSQGGTLSAYVYGFSPTGSWTSNTVFSVRTY
jgi:hypothetical protein